MIPAVAEGAGTAADCSILSLEAGPSGSTSSKRVPVGRIFRDLVLARMARYPASEGFRSGGPAGGHFGGRGVNRWNPHLDDQRQLTNRTTADSRT